MGYYLYVKSRPLLVAYDLLCGIFFMLTMVSYWRSLLRDNLNIANAGIFFALLSLEVYLSTTNGYKKLGMKIPDTMTELEMDRACALSLVFAAPAYIVGGLAMLEIIVKEVNIL